MSERARTGLVLAGGGARGAYEAGVLRFLFADLAPKLGAPVNMDVISGTSAGALNGTWLAGHGGNESAVLELSRLWADVRVEQMFTFRALDLLRNPRLLWQHQLEAADGSSLLDASALHDMVQRRFPWEGLQRRMAAGLLTALVISTTEVATGLNVLFTQHRDGAFPGFIPYPQVEVRDVKLGPAHVIASCAIPFLFPPVRIDGHYFADGSLRQNTPLAPALRLGMDKVLVIGVKRPFEQRSESTRANAPDKPPGLGFLLGKALNALTLEPIEREFHALQRYNSLFEWGAQAYGPDFLDRLNTVVTPLRGAPYRPVRALMIQPTEDLGRVAAEAWKHRPPDVRGATKRLFGLIADDSAEEADTLSYLLFDRGYTAEIERLGWEDARDRQQELADFLLAPRPG